ncbi:MAG TPA: 50S ribosomal protein L25 [Candidatus Bariatricus faecipullorum]|nr:50S ribosomal protein L25 [Candidatus Bariatricus faecipullorum]
MNTLKAEKRDMTVKAKKLRREGYVTGNVFGKEMEGSMPLKIAKQDAEKLMKSRGKGSRILLDVEGKIMNVLVKEIDYDAMKNQILEMDFQALVKGEKVNSVAEVVLLNHESVTDGVIQLYLTEIPYRAVPEALVEKVEIDVSQMRAGDYVLVKDLDIAKNKDIEIGLDMETPVMDIMEVRTAPEEEEAEEAAEE